MFEESYNVKGCFKIFCAIVLFSSAFALFLISNSTGNFYIHSFHRHLFWGNASENVTLIEKKSIFFLETTGCKIKYVRNSIITARQACAIESAAKMNPDKIVYLFYVLRNKNDDLYNVSFEDEILTGELLKYENIKIELIDLGEYMKGTPLEQWYATKKLDNSKYMVEHSSDILRYLTMWKYGGIYLDLDVVLMKSLEELGLNFIGAETDKFLANGILSFDSEGIGHEITSMLLKEISTDFRGGEWSYNGPDLVTRVLRKFCNVSTIDLMTPENCKGFQVLDPKKFYAIPYTRKNDFFDANSLSSAESVVNGSYTIHVWNKLSHDLIVYKDKPQVLYGKFAEKFCPSSFSNSGQTF